MIETPEWVQDAIFYQIFPDRFAKSARFGKPGDYPPKPRNLQKWGDTPTYHAFQGGDLIGIAERLDYLVDLGITAVYLNPIFASAANHRYHTYDYFQVDPLLGGNQAFTEFLHAAHKKGIRVILDGVFNHASRGFYQFNSLLENGQQSPYVDWFHVYSWPVNAFNEHHAPNYAAWWGMHSLPKLNTNTPEVREFLWDVATYWVRQGIDGWRLDVPNEIDDDEFWQEFRQRCKIINQDAYIVGEFWGEAHRWLQGDQFDGQMDYMFARAALGFFVGHNMDQTDTGRCGYGYIQPLNGHQFAGETNRIFNQLYDSQIAFSNLSMLGSHDTPRTGTIARNDKAALRMMYLFQMTTPGAPNIYYGDEIGMLGGHDPFCRGAFPWHAHDAWDSSLRSIIQFYIDLRKTYPSLRRGNFQVLFANECTVVYQRRYQNETAVVAFNAGHKEETIKAPTTMPRILHPRTQPSPLYRADEPLTLPPRTGHLWITH